MLIKLKCKLGYIVASACSDNRRPDLFCANCRFPHHDFDGSSKTEYK